MPEDVGDEVEFADSEVLKMAARSNNNLYAFTSTNRVNQRVLFPTNSQTGPTFSSEDVHVVIAYKE